jgi:hypothetical protein
MSCSVPANQPIYQALIDKAASYTADKSYQIKAYKNAAKTVLSYGENLYDKLLRGGGFTYPFPSGIGISIENFIYDFIKANPESKPTSIWEQLKEMVTPELYTTEKPRRSARIAAKAPAAKAPAAKAPVTKPVTKPIVTAPDVKYFPEKKKASTAVPLIRTYGADDDGYTTTGYTLYRANGKFEIINVGHCSCFDTVEILEGYDEDELGYCKKSNKI